MVLRSGPVKEQLPEFYGDAPATTEVQFVNFGRIPLRRIRGYGEDLQNLEVEGEGGEVRNYN